MLVSSHYDWWARQGLNLRPHPCEGCLNVEMLDFLNSMWRTDGDSSANKAGLADHSLTTRRTFDHASTLPRKASLRSRDGCWMYFLAGAGMIKIGITTNLTSRIRSIRNSSPVALDLLATMPACSFDEGQEHSRFSHLRRHGEWFEDEGSIRKYIEKLIACGEAKRP